MNRLTLSLTPVLAAIAVLERPREPVACTSCGHDAPTSTCTTCRLQICAHCRHEKHADQCDGCGSDIVEPEPEPEFEQCSGCGGAGACLYCHGRGFIRL